MIIHKVSTNDEGLRQSIRARLHRIFNMHTPLTSVAQQFFKARGVLWRGDHQNFADTAEHQSSQRVINHGLVIDRHELFAHRLCHWVKAGA